MPSVLLNDERDSILKCSTQPTRSRRSAFTSGNLQRGALPGLDLEEADSRQPDQHVGGADECLGREQPGDVAQARAGGELPTGTSAVSDREPLRERREPAGQAVEWDVDAGEEEQGVEQEVAEHTRLSPAQAERGVHESESDAGERGDCNRQCEWGK